MEKYTVQVQVVVDGEISVMEGNKVQAILKADSLINNLPEGELIYRTVNGEEFNFYAHAVKGTVEAVDEESVELV